VVEALASGIPAALTAVREAGFPDLDFYDQGITFTVVIRRVDDSNPQPPNSTQAASIQGNAVLPSQLSTPKTVAELTASLGISANAIRKRLAPRYERA
jgi:predicted HTH transcriptional regulator